MKKPTLVHYSGKDFTLSRTFFAGRDVATVLQGLSSQSLEVGFVGRSKRLLSAEAYGPYEENIEHCQLISMSQPTFQVAGNCYIGTKPQTHLA